MRKPAGLLAPAIGAFAASILWSTGGSAEILAAATRSAAQEGSGIQYQPVLLKDNGAKRLRFTTAARRTLVKVTFNAGCLVAEGSLRRSVAVRIQVDGQAVTPPSMPMCTKALGDSASAEVGAVYQAVLRVPNAGDHFVRVLARTSSDTKWIFHGSSLVVED